MLKRYDDDAWDYGLWRLIDMMMREIYDLWRLIDMVMREITAVTSHWHNDAWDWRHVTSH